MLRLLFIVGFALLVLGAAVALLAPQQLPAPLMARVREDVDSRQLAAPTLAATPAPVATATLTPTITPEPSATLTATPQCGPPVGWGIYIIQSGDTLSDLALRTGSSVDQIQRANCLGDSLIFAGNPLYLPRSPDPRPTALPATARPTTVPTLAATNPTITQLAQATRTPPPINLPPTATPTGSPISASPTAKPPMTGAATPTTEIVFIPATITPAQSNATQPASTTTPTATAAPASATPASPTLVPTPAPTAIFTAEYPARLDSQASAALLVMLILDGSPVPTPSQPDQTVVAATLAPVGTATLPLHAQFGSGYTAIARAHVDASSFEPVGEGAPQSLEQPMLLWSWSLKPKNKGQQKIIITVTGEWQPAGGGPPITRILWWRQLQIDVDEPLFTRGQISLSSLFCTLLGSVLSAPWLIDQFRRMLRERPARSRRAGRSRR